MSLPFPKLGEIVRYPGRLAFREAPSYQTVTLPVPPSANRYWRVFRGRAVKSQEARDYIALVWVLARQQKARIIRAAEVAIEVRWTRKARRGDLDNRLKCLLDALKGLAWADDRQIAEIHATRSQGPVDSIVVSWREVGA